MRTRRRIEIVKKTVRYAVSVYRVAEIDVHIFPLAAIDERQCKLENKIK